MKRLLSSIFALCLLIPPATAQFWEANPYILFDDVEDLLVLPNGSVLALVSGDGIFVSTDSGSSFSKVFDLSFTFEFARSLNRVFASGLNGTFISDDDGVSWSQLLPSDGWSVSANGVDVVIGGSASILFSSVDNGLTWTIPNADIIPFLRSTAILVAVRAGQLVGYKTIFSDLFVSTDGGTNWTTVDVIDPDVIKYMDGIFYADRFDEVWTSTDLQSWNQVGTDSGVFWDDIAVSSEAIAVSGDFSGLAVSTDNGTTWTDVGSELGTNRIISIAFLADGRLLAGTDTGVYRSVEPVTGAGGVPVEPDETVPSNPVMMEVFPNPSLGDIRVIIKLAEPGTYSVSLFDSIGRKVATLADASFGLGIQELGWTYSLSSGVYYVVLESETTVITRKVVVLGDR